MDNWSRDIGPRSVRLLSLSCALVFAASGCPSKYTPGLLPRQLEGFRLGDHFSKAITRLKTRGWLVEISRHRLGRSQVIRAQAHKRAHPTVERITLQSAGNRIVFVRIKFRPSAYARGKQIAAVCTRRNLVGGAGYYVQCVDDKRQFVLTARREGSRATLVDLDALVAAGALTRKALEERITHSLARLTKAMAGRTALTMPGAAKPLPRGVEDFTLGEPMDRVMGRLAPRHWSVRLRTRRRRGIAYRQILARARTASSIHEVKLGFFKGRLAQIRVYYREAADRRFQRLVRRCRGHVLIPVRLGYHGCRDRDWNRFLGISRTGTFVRLLDLGSVLPSGVITRQEVGGAR